MTSLNASFTCTKASRFTLLALLLLLAAVSAKPARQPNPLRGLAKGRDPVADNGVSRSKRHAAEMKLQDILAHGKSKHRRLSVLFHMMDLIDSSGTSCRCLQEKKRSSSCNCPLVVHLSALLRFLESSPHEQSTKSDDLAKRLSNLSRMERLAIRRLVQNELRRIRQKLAYRNWQLRRHMDIRIRRKLHPFSVFQDKQLVSY